MKQTLTFGSPTPKKAKYFTIYDELGKPDRLVKRIGGTDSVIEVRDVTWYERLYVRVRQWLSEQ